MRDTHVDPSPETPTGRPWRRWAAAGATAAGAAGLAAAFLTANTGPEPTAGPVPEIGIETSTPTAAGGATPTPAATTRRPASKAPAGSTATTTRTPTLRQRVAAAKAAPRAPLAAPIRKAATISGVQVAESGNLRKDRQTLRVVSARADLTGQRELAWVADGGAPVGTARCTQNFRFSTARPAKVRPTLLLCWRTSAARSAYTVMVNLNGRPSREASIAALDSAWAKL
ncbi:hypothetical protein GCM10010123_25690 [Pilimelia anulata]|uniref:Uncharacterized protein n=1 Tax=Pilimelia anulata TaxID=53371 RepID=A0A8J3BB67_9ACTN|nr:hypothetical protein [Pilimelia anulata]GGJ94744.1 hypothetical protein GCM10010123_25690 [Pilimelia anulata]